jgi:hypothetical protein
LTQTTKLPILQHDSQLLNCSTHARSEVHHSPGRYRRTPRSGTGLLAGCPVFADHCWRDCERWSGVAKCNTRRRSSANRYLTGPRIPGDGISAIPSPARRTVVVRAIYRYTPPEIFQFEHSRLDPDLRQREGHRVGQSGNSTDSANAWWLDPGYSHTQVFHFATPVRSRSPMHRRNAFTPESGIST